MVAIRNLILGAGLTGLTAAYHLPQEETLVLERDDTVGGLCRSREIDGFTFDCTGHLLHLKAGPTRELVDELLPGKLRLVDRRSLVYSKGVYTGYPFQANTFGLPPQVIQECVVGFVESLLNHRRDDEQADNFLQWALDTFGEGIARHFMLPYNQKLYRIDLSEMECGWVSWSIPRPTLQEVVGGALGLTGRPLGYNAQFFYPKLGGIEALPNSLADRCGPIQLSCGVKSVDPLARSVTLASGQRLSYERLISTLPLDALLRMLSPCPSGVAPDAASTLRAVKVVNFNFGINRADVLPAHWVYFPEPAFVFYRVGSPSAYSDGVAPRHCSSLYVEVARRRDEAIDLDALRQEVLEGLTEAKILHERDRILVEETLVLDPAYVIYDHARRDRLPGMIQALAQHGIISTGRYGAWEYGSMASAMKQGREAADTLGNIGTTRRITQIEG